MGRYYHGDIEGKFWVGVQSSDDGEFFGAQESRNHSYNDQMIIDYYKEHFKEDITEEKIRHLLAWYARLLLGKEILECVEENGQCAFTAEL